MSTPLFSDPIFSSQWYLINTGQRGGASRLDLNVLPAWQMGFNGTGVRVAINDDGMDLSHPDLVTNIEAGSVFDTNRATTGQGFSGAPSEHGTVVGSIVGMAANGQGGVGVAYKATLLPALAVEIADNVLNSSASLFAANLSAKADVSVNSWGSDPAFSENFGASGSGADQAWGAQLLRNATVGRNGLGMFIEVSAGNSRDARADTSLSNFTGNKVVASVAAVDQFGVVTAYSTPGASNLVSAFGGVRSADQSVNEGYGIPSADIQSAAGYNKTSGATGDYSYQNEGTSYSGPMVGAAAALILQANPSLGFRDVSSILAATARQTDVSNTSWVTTAASQWNLAGAHFSRDYGFGLIDIAAAVRLAQSWTGPAATVANWIKAEGVASQSAQSIPDDSTTALTVTTQVTGNVRIDRVEFDLNLTAISPSQLKAQITSPSGTTITLFDQPLARPLKDGAPDTSSPETAWPDTFTIGATAFLGETSSGTWILKLTDMVSGSVATFNSLTVRAWGSAISNDNQYVITDEFKGSKTLVDAAGVDTLNAAAFSRAVTLNIGEQGSSQVGEGSIAIAAGTTIENVFGGAGDDLLTGNSEANTFRGNGGNDRLNGGSGEDTVIQRDKLRDYKISLTNGSGTVTDSVSDRDGVDTLSSIEHIRFSDFDINTGIKAVASAVSSASLQRVIELYVAFFNRTPDADGLSYWLTQTKAGMSTNAIADAFYGAGTQYTSLTGFSSAMTNADFVNVIYKNVLGRADGADAGGLTYWTGELASGNASRGSLASTMLDSAHTFKGDATWGWVANLLDNKIAVAKQVAVDWGLNYLTPEASVSNGMAIAKAVTATDTSAAIALVGIPAEAITLG